MENTGDKRAHGTVLTRAAHPRAKLTEAGVEFIRSSYAAGGVTHRELARSFGVSRTTISAVLQGRNWPGLPKGEMSEKGHDRQE